MTLSKKVAATQLLNNTIATVFGVPTRKGELYGIEFENELDEDHNPLPMNPINREGFKVIRDGSLRGAGYEFVSSPQTLEQLKNRITGLCGLVKDFPWSYSRRTSTHVHMNMSDKTAPELMKFLALYWMMEPVILLSLKPSRVGNTFCVTSNVTRDIVITSVTKKWAFPLLDKEDETKYASMNLTTLAKLGTAECRLFHSSFDDVEIHRWLDSLDGILQASKKVKTLQELKDKFIQKEPLEFIQGVWGRRLTDTYRGFGPIEDALRDGFSSVRPLLRTGKTLAEMESFLFEEEQRQKKRLAAAQEALKRDVDILTYLEEAPENLPAAPPPPEFPPAHPWDGPEFPPAHPWHGVAAEIEPINPVAVGMAPPPPPPRRFPEPRPQRVAFDDHVWRWIDPPPLDNAQLERVRRILEENQQ